MSGQRADSLAVVRDAFVACTDRRHELSGTKWSHSPRADQPWSTSVAGKSDPGATVVSSAGFRLLPDPPPRAGSLHQRCAHARALPPAVKLSLLLRYAAMPLRWSAAGGTHRGVGSGGALYAIEYRLLDRTNRLTLTAVPDELALAVIGRPPDKPASSPDQLDLLLVARLGRCLAEYGEFSLPLLALEIGMHHVQLVLLARALGWEVTMNHQVAAHAFQDVTQANHWSDLPLLRLAVRGPGIGAAVPSLPYTSRVQKRTQAPADDDGFAGLRLLVEASQSDGEEAIGRRAHRAAPPPSRPGPTFDPFALAERRSSGRAAQAWCGDWAWETVDDYFRTVAALLTDGMPGAAEQGAPLSSIAITIRAKRDDPVALYAFDHRTGRRQAIRGTDRMMAAATASLDRNTRLAVTIGVDDLAALERFGARAFVEAHLTAGAIGHCFCLAAAAHDMTARPVCSFIAAEANLLLPLEARALLQVQIEPRCGMPPDYLVT